MTFEVKATSGTALSFQWYKDGLLDLDLMLAGETSSTLTIKSVGPLDVGTFYVEVKNAGGTVTSRHASLNIALVNSAPVANDNTYTTLANVSLNVTVPGVLANDTDAENNALTARLVSNAMYGNVNLNANGRFVYVPNTNFIGSDKFAYVAYDGSTTGNVATVTINVTPAGNSPPRITSQRMTPAGFELQVSGIDSAACVIWASSNLRDWDPISTNAPLVGALVFTDPAASKYSSRFYRVEAR